VHHSLHTDRSDGARQTEAIPQQTMLEKISWLRARAAEENER